MVTAQGGIRVRFLPLLLVVDLVHGTTVSVGSNAQLEELVASDAETLAADELGDEELSGDEDTDADASSFNLAELGNMEVRRGAGELSADHDTRIGSEMEDMVGATTWSFVNLGAEKSLEIMRQGSELSTLSAGTAGPGARRSYRTATAVVGSQHGKVTEWSSLALAGRSFMGFFRNASSESPGRLKIFALEPAQVTISTMKTSEEKGEVLGREEIQTFSSEENDVLQLTSTGDVVVQSMEESWDFLQLAPVDEAVYGYCHEVCAIMAFDRQATGLVEECADGSTKSYNQQDMMEETYWSVTSGKACRWHSSDGSLIAGTSRGDAEHRASISFLPVAYFQDTTPFPMTLTSVKIIGSQSTSCQVDGGKSFTLQGSGSVYSAELPEVAAKSHVVCDQGVMVFGLDPGLKDTVQLVTAPAGRKAAYTKFGSGVCDGNEKFNKFTLEEEYPTLSEEKNLDWKLITTREAPGICNAESVDECFHLCSVVSECKFFATHFAVNCQACLLFKSCPSRAGVSSLVEDTVGGDSQTADLQMYDIFQLEQSESEVNAEKNLVKNPSFNDGKSGWTEFCPPMSYNGKNLTFGCQNEGVSTSISKELGGDTTAYHIKGNCWQGSRGGVYQDIKTELGYTYTVTFKVIDGWFDKKNSKEEKSWVEVQSPVSHPVMDEEIRTGNSLKTPTSGQWETKGPFKFVAASETSRLFFYTGGTACTNIDEVVVRKTKDAKLAVFSFATLIQEKNFIVTKGSFVSSDNSSAGSSIKVLKENTVVMKPSEASGDGSDESAGENDMDINTRDLTTGGCSRVSGFVRYVPTPLYQYDEGEVNNGSLMSTVSFEIQEPVGQRLGKAMEIGVTGAVLNAALDPSPESMRIRVKMEETVDPEEEDEETKMIAALRSASVVELQMNFFCQGGGDTRKAWRLNTYEYAGNEGLCISLAARDSIGMGCHEVTCRQNPTSDASLQPCNEEDWAQNFYADGKLLRSASPADRCLAVDYKSKSSSGCKPITLKLCDSSDPGQRWSVQGGRRPQELAQLRMEDGFVASVPKAAKELASFDMKVQACKEQDVANVKSWNQIPSPMMADLVRLHELGSNFTQTASMGSGELLVAKVWAEAICPWYFNPPIHTDSHLIKCYNDELCDPAEDGEDCCAAKGGTFMCSSSAPYMCKAKKNGEDPSDYFCVQENVDCEIYGGRRPCEGPPGLPGSSGEAGDQGEVGEEGPQGLTGLVTDAVLPPSGAKHMLSHPASNAEVLGALVVNLGMAFLVFRNLKAKVKDRLEGKAGSVAPRS